MNKNNDIFEDKETLSARMHLQEEALALYVDALLQKRAPQLPVELIDHVENCPQCQAQILETHMYLKNPLAPPAPAQIKSILSPKKRGLVTWLPLASRVAATLFVVSLLAAVYFSFSGNDSPFSPVYPVIKSFADQNKTIQAKQSQNPSPPNQAKNDTGHKQKEPASVKSRENLSRKANAFAINHNLEFMVGSRSRSFIVEVHSPVNNTSFKEGIMFSWREFGHEPLSLVILNNRNQTVFKSPISDGHFQFSDKLPPGCYYWKLESANELYYVGKFFIEPVLMFPK
jgi:hypothetical protein